MNEFTDQYAIVWSNGHKMGSYLNFEQDENIMANQKGKDTLFFTWSAFLTKPIPSESFRQCFSLWNWLCLMRLCSMYCSIVNGGVKAGGHWTKHNPISQKVWEFIANENGDQKQSLALALGSKIVWTTASVPLDKLKSAAIHLSWMQWAAVKIHCGAMSVPPQKWLQRCEFPRPAGPCKLTCHGHWVDDRVAWKQDFFTSSVLRLMKCVIGNIIIITACINWNTSWNK